METSNFANNQWHDLNGISISRYPATRQGFKGPEFPPLMPSSQLLTWYKDTGDWAKYAISYNRQLTCLNAQNVWHHLESMAGASEPILICYESAKTLDTQPCHRRLVAAWFERELGMVVPEWEAPQC
jgi:hypothetical protein